METLRWYSSRLEWPDLSHSAALQAPIAYLHEPCLAQMTNVTPNGLLVEAGVPLQLIVTHPVVRLAELRHRRQYGGAVSLAPRDFRRDAICAGGGTSYSVGGAER
jgi:hypothetical protein